MPSSGPEIPVIDIASIVSGDRGGESGVSRRIGAACREIGFFYITGHGVPSRMRERVFAMAADFFTGPGKRKEAVAYKGVSSNRGYIPLGGETLDPTKPADAKEAFNIGLELTADDPDVSARAPFRALNVWPDIPEFRSVMLEYFDCMWKLGLLLHRSFAVDLGLDSEFFASKFRKPMAVLRLLHYPAASAPRVQGQLGAGVHTDYGNVTLLATDAVEGLMVRDRSGRWLDAPVVPDSFVCNIGDCLMRWTNDVYVSTPHKVVNPHDRDRYSVAFFLDPDPDALVACVPTCVNLARPARYPPITAADFLRSRLEPTYAR
jgi:isopenicillin N synthase-like dioxygenase